MEAEYAQVRSRDRVRDLAEVFTHRREVDAMLDLVADAFTEVDVKFLEPACGSGNFLVAILRRKLALVSAGDCAGQEHFEFRMLRAAASVYGVDISRENVTEARARCGHVLLEHFQSEANTVEPSAGFLSAAVHIVGHNIVAGDTINAAQDIELCDWQPHPGGRFVRVWSPALVPEGERDLFWVERVQDTSPVHYSALADEPPVKAGLKRTGRRR
ncbi:MAG: type III restriction endonuclease subunit M [Actinobacteria bacterium]|nr:type III restriction endonuclease subunit M [Actinomycetota bacterium]